MKLSILFSTTNLSIEPKDCAHHMSAGFAVEGEGFFWLLVLELGPYQYQPFLLSSYHNEIQELFSFVFFEKADWR